MPEKLKDLFFSTSFIEELARRIGEAYPGFDERAFRRLVFDEQWERLELKAKMHHVTYCLGRTLPAEFPRALEILRAVARSFDGFDAMVFPDFVARYGLEHWELSMPALAEFTPLASSEFAVRPFVARDPRRAMAYLEAWAEDANDHVRRLASEGCRPRLPWGMALQAFKRDPMPILPVLEKLKDDESQYVCKSVANNLNDISKDHPDLVLELAESWYGCCERTDWIVKHACRTMLKRGNRRALALFGFGDPAQLRVRNLKLSPDQPRIGASLEYQFELDVGAPRPCKVRLDLAVDYRKASGRTTRKVFAIRESEFGPGKHVVTRRLSFADQSTRKHHPGRHSVAIIVNGAEMARASFELLGSTAPGD
jgi:3-methyladenine DNA glycosylase AlkC